MNLETVLGEMQTKAANAAPIGNSLKFDLGTGQCIYIDGTGDSNKVSAENKDADCTVKVSLDNLISLAKGDLNPMTAFMTGKIKVEGNMGVAMKLQSLLS